MMHTHHAGVTRLTPETPEDVDAVIAAVLPGFTNWKRKENASAKTNPLALAQTQTDAPELTRAS